MQQTKRQAEIVYALLQQASSKNDDENLELATLRVEIGKWLALENGKKEGEIAT